VEVRGPRSSERRIARRVAPEDLRLWVEVMTARPLRRPRVDRIDCVVVDVSVTGALLLVPESPVWAVGHKLVLHADPTTTADVAVRRVAAATAGHLHVGVDFRRLTPSFAAIVNQIVAQGDTASERRWHHANAD
jgi:hypothetical protein